MKIVKRNFGHRIEEIATHIGDEVCRAKNHELECIKTGYINDEEKLKMLKRDLYEVARSRANHEHIQNLKQAINIISQQLETERTYQNSFGYQLTGVINSIILLALLATGFSFPATWTCNVFKNQSKACQVSRVIPTSTFQFFNDPKKSNAG